MSTHKKPLTTLEEVGVILHGFGKDIGKPSICIDIFRFGMAWAKTSLEEQIFSIEDVLYNDLSLDKTFKTRLEQLMKELNEQKCPS